MTKEEWEAFLKHVEASLGEGSVEVIKKFVAGDIEYKKRMNNLRDPAINDE